MATYFPSLNNQRDAGTVLYFRQSLPDSYSEAPTAPGNMMMFMNYSSSSGPYSDTLASTSQQENNRINAQPVGASDSNTSQQEILSNLGGTRTGIHDFTAWKDSGNEMLLMHSMSAADNALQVAQNMEGQGLSLSLASHIPSGIEVSHVQCQNLNQGFTSFLSPAPSIPGEGSGGNASFGDDNNSHTEQRSTDFMPPGYPGSNSDPPKVIPSGMSSIARSISNSKYLKAAQQLLDELVNVRKAIKEHSSKKELIKDSNKFDEDSKNRSSDPPVNASCSKPQGSQSNQIELSATEKQELQHKLTKLLSMLDEIDRRYRQYYHQMQIVVSSFDVIAGDGAAKPYTALALQTISRHFRCLHDAISGQIQKLRKSLGEQDVLENSMGVGISRLRYVDQHIRQHRALQQLGMMQQHAWRPQRGLPESSVSVLRAWLFEHFLHPYPKDSDKIMLARQTGLTRSQVSNWFINARVRLWKPMVEEMYKEETGDTEMHSNSSSEVAPGLVTKDSQIEEREEFQKNATSVEFERHNGGEMVESKSNHVTDVEMEGAINAETQSESGMENQREESRPAMNNYTLVPNTFNDRFMAAAGAAFHISELGRFGSGSGVSLTLGLQQHEGGSLPTSIETHASYFPIRGDSMYSTAPTAMVPETVEFNYLESGNRHMLHDFAA